MATDAGREGELIFRYVHEYLGCKKPFQRLWISSLTDRAILDGFKNLRPGSDYDNLYLAAKARRESDWMVGINASQALTIAAGSGNFSLGRVQTPTMALVCERYLENKDFVPKNFYQLQLVTEKSGIGIRALNAERYPTKKEADDLAEKAAAYGTATVCSIEKKDVHKDPPLPFDLTSLQKEANVRYGYTAEQTLSAAQQLYEMQVISYPRTGSRYFTSDLYETIQGILASLKENITFAEYAGYLLQSDLNAHAVNNDRVTDHHALIPTGKTPDTLSICQRNIYHMIVARLLETLSGVCDQEVTTVTFDCVGMRFEAKNTKIINQGWKAVSRDEDDDQDAFALPELYQDEQLPVKAMETLSKKTKPKPLYTEASLLAAMESAGKDLEDEDQREVMKECGLGTPATRAGIIELLVNRDYIARDQKSLVPTEKGLKVYDAVKGQQISDVEMTGMWEASLHSIEKGVKPVGEFMRQIKTDTAQITNEVLNSRIAGFSFNSIECPKCGRGTMYLYNKVAKCNNSECGHHILRLLCGKYLTDAQLLTVLGRKKTPVIKGFVTRKGKKFSASLTLDENHHIRMEYDY